MPNRIRAGRRSVLVVAASLFFSAPASAQMDLTGEWNMQVHEDQPERLAGPNLGDFAGLPINDAGRMMAEWILEGEPSIDVWELNVRRFGAHLRDRRYVAEKAREVYRYYYAPRFPCDESEWGRPLRTSPLVERLLGLGAVFGERGGWERAHYFVPGSPGRRQGADERTWERPSHR